MPPVGHVERTEMLRLTHGRAQYPPACSMELARGIKSAQVIFFERSGHFPYIEEPEAFRAAVAAFLAQASPGAAGEGMRRVESSGSL